MPHAFAPKVPRSIAPSKRAITEETPDTFPDRYVIRCYGDCLEPLIPANSRMVIEKHGTITAGDLVALFIRSEFVLLAGHRVLVKRLAINVPPWVRKFPYSDPPGTDSVALVVVETLNPRRRFAIRCSSLLGMHKAIGPLPSDARYDQAAKLWRLPPHIDLVPSTNPIG